MHLQITGKQIDIGDALKVHAEDRLDEAVGKYFSRPTEVAVTFNREGSGFRCDLQIHLPSGMTGHAHAVAQEIYLSFDDALERLEKQLRRYKRRLKDHHKDREGSIPFIEAASYVISTPVEDEEASESEPETLDPVIVAETTTDIREFTVGEAVMQLELSSSPAMLFRNSAHGGLNMVYRRPDGNIGWVDPDGRTRRGA
ncbi:MAG: ribosome-associated translation inhibitor RaiA [Alphaproteobacteria bacterium]|nr:ribosome-associated translation inhibitor RaiA [Alphaproteobacteria bacterium]MDX5369436.1 ribosome-associated translation inhibitor RaiA [Alphaproteobacteria bacterium]MDX5464116.1 ribosome-associated translation inhibitor RaiA [Alphaproteobacteria bacterium]